MGGEEERGEIRGVTEGWRVNILVFLAVLFLGAKCFGVPRKAWFDAGSVMFK